MTYRYSIDEIKAMLEARVDALARELVPGGHKDGHHWRSSTAWGGEGQSFCITLAGSKQGLVKDFSAGGKAIDLLGLIGLLHFGSADKVGEAIKWALSWLGLENDTRSDAERRASAERAAQERAAREQQAAEEERERAIKAYKNWQRLKMERPSIAGTPVEEYLKGRAIDLRLLGRAPGSLVFDPECWCEEAGARLPAMVALVQEAHGAAPASLGVHRTWLECVNGRWIKARLDNAKKSLGPIKGGIVKLWRGASGRELQRAPQGSVLLLAEGIEDALTGAIARPHAYAAAAVSVANMAAIRPPAAIAEIVLLDQNDERPDAPGLSAARAEAMRNLERAKKSAIANWQHQGKRVRRLALPATLDGAPIKDINDFARALSGRGAQA